MNRLLTPSHATRRDVLTPHLTSPHLTSPPPSPCLPSPAQIARLLATFLLDAAAHAVSLHRHPRSSRARSFSSTSLALSPNFTLPPALLSPSLVSLISSLRPSLSPQLPSYGARLESFNAAVEPGGLTPLLAAVPYGRVPLVRMLLDSRADPTAHPRAARQLSRSNSRERLTSAGGKINFVPVSKAARTSARARAPAVSAGASAHRLPPAPRTHALLNLSTSSHLRAPPPLRARVLSALRRG